MIKGVSNFFGTKFLLPKIFRDCKITDLVNSSNFIIDKVYLFEKNIYQNVYVIEDQYTDEIIYIGTNITGYFKFKGWHITIPQGVDIIGKNSSGTEMVIKNIFITRNSRTMKNNQSNCYIRFVATKIIPVEQKK